MGFPQINTSPSRVSIGAERLLSEETGLVGSKTIGILTNHTGRLPDGTHIVDAIVSSGIGRVRALFGPEHGMFGDIPDGQAVGHARHPRYDVPIYSLYGDVPKPTPEMLNGIELIVCDLQDIGARFYTYSSTVALVLEAAAERGISFLLLDRPNPIRGIQYDGPVRTSSLKSFVGWMPIPVTHGLTIGELTRLWNEEGYLAGGVKAELKVVEMRGWKREMWFDDTGLPWIAPSPNMRTLSAAVVYPGACLLEGTSISEGRGTSLPFELMGAPWADPDRVLKALSEFSTPGVRFAAEEFSPSSIPGRAVNPKYENTRCRGIRVVVTDRDAIQPVRLGIALLAAFKRAHPAETWFHANRFDLLAGSRQIRQMLEGHVHPDEISRMWATDLEAFGRLREKYMMY